MIIFYILSILILIFINIILFIRYKKKVTWKIVYVDKNNRGVNSDTWYWEVPSHDGKKVWLTDEQLIVGKIRASGLDSHPSVKIETT